MDFVHGGPSGLEISSLKLVMQELASLPDDMVPENCADAIRRLQDTCKKIEDMLEGWNGDQISGTVMETLLDSLEGYCYDLEDIIDGIRLDKRAPDSVLGSFTANWSSKFDDLHRDFERVCDEIGRVWMPQEPTHLKPQELRINQSPVYESLSLDRTHLVGRDDDLQFIIREMCDGLFCGVSIIGMDGLGKTSLARCIIGDEHIRKQFKLILSTSVSAHFQIEDIVHKLLASYSETKRKATDSDPPDLRDVISGRRTLIILDDLWSVKDGDWQSFQSTYLRGSKTTKVLITTRNPKVAAVTDTTAHYLGGISDEACKSLIMAAAKSGLKDSESDIWASDVGVITTRNPKVADVTDTTAHYLGGISDEECKSLIKAKFDIWASGVGVIATKCQGMPMVAAMFGFKLSKKRSLDEQIESMEQITSINLWELPEFKEVFPSLKLNEPKIQPHLKRCFAYFSLFPPNHLFNKEDLIQSWEAQGFVRPQHQAGSHPTGSQCFNDLVSRSILRTQKSSNEMQPLYGLNVFHHEFARLLASKAFLNLDGGTLSFLDSCKNVRHLNLSCENIDVSLLEQMKECKGLRSFIVHHPQWHGHSFIVHHPEWHERSFIVHPPQWNLRARCTISLTFLHEFKSLRLLNLSHTKITELPMIPSQLLHLRYLDLSGSDIKSLPDPIHSLRELQTLKLRNCYNLKLLPRDFNQLTNLMCLYVDMKRLECVPPDMRKLINLEILCSFAVRIEGNTIAELMKNMNRLREIHISGLQNIPSTTAAQESMLSEKHTLKRLVLEWDWVGEVEGPGNVLAGNVLEGLQPHNDLKELIVINYACQQFPPWLTSSTRKLVSILLKNCLGYIDLPSLGQLPLLKTLVLDSIHNVEIVDEKFFGEGEGRFPSLESLEFCNMKKLYRWICLGKGGMPWLHSLTFINCPSLAFLPSLLHQSRLRSLEIINCPRLEVLPKIHKHVEVEKKVISYPLAIPNSREIHSEMTQWKGFEGSTQRSPVRIPDMTFSSTSQPLDKNKVQRRPEITPAQPSKQDDGGHILQDKDEVSHPVIMEERKDVLSEDKAAGEYFSICAIMLRQLGKVINSRNSIFVRRCFSILSLLPKDYEFEEDTLIQLWMAASHIKKKAKGKQHFNHLLKQEYLLRSGTNFFTNKGIYHINIDTCQNFSEGQNYTLKWENECNMDNYEGVQHVSLVFKGIDQTIFQKLQQFRELRTLLFLANYGARVTEIPAHFFKSFEKLRALDLSGTHIKKLPSSVGYMQQLRYLDLSRTLIEWLPVTIRSLKELQTLKLQECWELNKLPEQLNELTKLRDLDVDVLSQLTTMPKGMKALHNLRTLSAFLVGTEEGYKVNELKNLNNLTGDFCIAKLENVGSKDEARNAALDRKKNIKRLELRWTAPAYSLTDNKSDPSVVLERLEPCSDLEELQILCYEGSTFPSWVSNPNFKKLVHVSFYKCENMSNLPPLEQLPSLKYLVLVQMNNVVEGFEVQERPNMVAFPSLETLKMDGMQSLRTLRLRKTNGDDFKSLTEITINDCPSLQEFDGLLSLSSIKCLEISKCPKLPSLPDYESLSQTLTTLANSGRL